jgi:hypothetical protein
MFPLLECGTNLAPHAHFKLSASETGQLLVEQVRVLVSIHRRLLPRAASLVKSFYGLLVTANVYTLFTEPCLAGYSH